MAPLNRIAILYFGGCRPHTWPTATKKVNLGGAFRPSEPPRLLTGLTQSALFAFGRAVFSMKVFHFLRVAQKVEHKSQASTMLPQAKV
jgi:hypothetical protein